MTELATTPNPTKSKTGSSLRRVEDAHLLVGKGRFTDNRPPSGQLHLHFIRSYLAHGRIVSIDKEEALRSDGVVAIYTAEDLWPMGSNLCRLPTNTNELMVNRWHNLLGMR